MKKGELRVIMKFILAILLTILTHYLLISRFSLHPTIHVAISLFLFWIFLAIIALIKMKKKRK
ncbi:MAG: hypothetical protein KKB79_00020 [Nanoarchaeota archaeon]|nr:hypothetical protein [Nanoarchaeota archaeon]